MIDEKKLINDLMNNECMDFSVRIDATTPEALGKSAQEIVDKMKEGFFNLINRQPKILVAQRERYWFNPKTQQPQNFVSVIINTPGDYPLPVVHEGYLTTEGIWITIYGEAYTMDEVPWWMPMPEPPEVGEGK